MSHRIVLLAGRTSPVGAVFFLLSDIYLIIVPLGELVLYIDSSLKYFHGLMTFLLLLQICRSLKKINIGLSNDSK